MKGTGLTAERGQPTPRYVAEDGDREALWLTELLLQFELPLTLYATRITRDIERARDVVQETFMRLLKEDRTTIEPHVAEWLYTVCRNKALDIRRKERRMVGLSDYAAHIEPSREAGPDAVLEHQESIAKALRHLARLPDNQQEVIRLKFQGDLSYREISRVTGLTVSHVGVLIHTGLKSIRTKLCPTTHL